jgi:hypothetical protein
MSSMEKRDGLILRIYKVIELHEDFKVFVMRILEFNRIDGVASTYFQWLE